MFPLFMLLTVCSLEGIHPEIQTLTGSNHGHTYIVRLEILPFQRKAHRIIHEKDDSYRVDGRIAIGTDGYALPFQEYSAFDVWVDGKRWKVPDRLWRDCFDPEVNAQAKLSKDGKRLTIRMEGSDGAGAYTVTWHLREDGRDTRHIEGPP